MRITGSRFQAALLTVWTVYAASAVAVPEQQRPAGGIEVFPKHFQLRPGETIRFQSMEDAADGRMRFLEEYSLSTSNPKVFELKDQQGLFLARSPGRAEMILRSGNREQHYQISVGERALPQLGAVPYREVDSIVGGKELLFVGHANRDGFDHTAIAKTGIDRVVREFKRNGHRVVYFVSEEFPDWYTEDRQPYLSVISEGQEHRILADANRVVFTGGDFMLCLLRNVQMTLHRLLQAGTRDTLHFVFPAEAIWTGDHWGPGPPRRYPAPAVLLGSVWDHKDSDAARYDDFVVPFLDTLFTKFPVLAYPTDAPTPALSALVHDWNVQVRVGQIERTYRKVSSTRTIRLDFVRRYEGPLSRS